MAQTIGVAGWQYGSGRVAAMTKAINLENLSAPNEDFFVRLFLNTCLWAIRNSSSNANIGIFSNDEPEFDNKIRDLFLEMGYFSVTMLDPWYEEGESPFNFNPDLYVLIPSYSAFDGVRMPDQKQSYILDQIYNNRVGLFLGEWFHLLQSISIKKSFSLSSDDTLGLFEASPLNIERSPLIFTDADDVFYSEVKSDESISANMTNKFLLRNFSLDTPFKGHLTQMTSIKETATVFWTTDISSTDEVTTTTTTQPPIVYEDIKLKIFDLNLVNACGPQKLYLSGDYKDFFFLEGNELFLAKMITEPQTISVNIVAEDYFRTKRLKDVVETVTIEFLECDAPISTPKDGSGPAFSYRVNGGLVQSIWGEFSPVGIITPFSDFSYYGRGTPEEPFNICLGGNHSDVNTFWMQINQGGEITAKITTSMESSYGTNDSLDHAKLFLIQNSGEYQTNPYQHEQDLSSWDNEPHITQLNHNGPGAFVIDLSSSSGKDNFGLNNDYYYTFRENNTYTFTFNAENPNSVNEEGDPLIDDVFLVLYYQKDLLRSENDDNVCGNFFIGTTPPPPPDEYDYIVFIDNNIENTLVFVEDSSDPVTAVKFTSEETDSVIDNVITIRLTALESSILQNVNTDLEYADINHEGYIVTNIRSINSSSVYIDITIQEMPKFGGRVVLSISGATATTTTTTTLPPVYYPVTFAFTDHIPNLSINVYGVYSQYGRNIARDLSCASENLCTFYVPAGEIFVEMQWHTSQGYEYRLDQAATGNGPGSTNPLYTHYDRPTVTQIISQSSFGMVSLPSPTPNSSSTESVIRSTRCCYNQDCSDGSATCGYIVIPIDVPVLGGSIHLRLGYPTGTENDPDAVTTPPPPPTTPEPCDDTIYVICQQVLDCSENANGSCVPTSNSYQRIVLGSCCPISQAEMLDIVRAHNSASSTASLLDMYPNCDPSVFDYIGDCLLKDANNECQETIHNNIIDAVSCGSSSNPLP